MTKKTGFQKMWGKVSCITQLEGKRFPSEKKGLNRCVKAEVKKRVRDAVRQTKKDEKRGEGCRRHIGGGA